MSYIVNERWDALKHRVSPRAWLSVRRMAARRGMTLSAVVKEHQELLPIRLRSHAASCFVDTYHEWLLSRQVELEKELRTIKRKLAKAIR